MSISEDEEILQDFLVEAGEILELLGEQLVELEQNPEDEDLLNAVFRGFHTVKGGAGFLNIVPMIDVCHRAEDVFNVLRQGERKISPDLMDAILKVVDILNDQFEQINSGEELVVAEASLLKKLESYATPDDGSGSDSVVEETVDEVVEAPVESESAKPEEETPAVEATPVSENESDDITEEEFDALLDALEGKESKPAKVEPAVEAKSDEDPSGDITEEEFDALLDELQANGGGPPAAKPTNKQSTPKAESKPVAASDGDVEEADAGNITDDEFDNLLDELHGKGKFTKTDSDGKPKAKPVAATAKKSEPKKPEPAKAAAELPKVVTKTADATVRVDTKRLDQIMNMVGELVLVRNRLDTLKSRLNNEEISKAVANLDIVTSDLQASVMKTRMQPIKKVFGRFPRVVRDLARALDKDISLEMMGEETDLDKNLVEALSDPMVHLVRNSVDHGIEMPDDREKAGKTRAGTIVLSAAQEGDHILLSIEDDGAGMDANVLRQIAIDKGVMDAESASRLDDRECYNLIFAPGFSTKAEISDISGRGVGMDVVKTRISQLNGTIDIDSELGKGTRINIKLPLTLAILPTLMVKVGERPFALPLSSVNEIFCIESYTTNIVDGQLVVMVRNKAMPIFYLNKWLADASKSNELNENDQVVVANVGNRKVGFVVNQVVGQEEVVIKPLGAMLHGLPGFAGATITGDGRIALILDIPSLMRARASSM